MRKVPVLTLAVMVAALLAAPTFANDHLITNDPAIDNNNRIVGEEGGNIFYNGIGSSGMIESVVNLGLPDGGNGTPGGGSPGGAATIVTIADLTLEADRTRSTEILAEGDNTASVEGQISATLNEDGSYAVTAEEGFNNDLIVTFGVNTGSEQEAVHLLAAPAVDVSLAEGDVNFGAAGSFPAGELALNGDSAEVVVQPGQGVLAFAANTVSVGEYATISFDYEADGAANMAAIGFDGGLNGLAVNYCQLSGGNVAEGETKNIAVTLNSNTGAVLPSFQVVNTAQDGGPISVTISNFKVIQARPLSDYQVDPSLTVDTAALADWNLGGINNPTGSAAVADGVLSLTAAEGEVANALTNPAIPTGTVTLEAMVQKTSDGPDASAFFALVLTDGANTINAYVPETAISDSEEMMVVVSGTTTTGMANSFFVTQTADFSADVSSAVIRDVEDGSDQDLLGL